MGSDDDIVKPSSPTPVASKTHKLSLIDQISPPIYITLIFFYQNDNESSSNNNKLQLQEEISRRLKQSLSHTLTTFHPLAGTIKHNSHVDCNDRGAAFVEARFPALLQHFTQNPNPNMEELSELLPLHDDHDAILSVKASFFDCGGFSVGICLSHKVADFASTMAFMNAWASTCRRKEEEEEDSRSFRRPFLDLALHFPQRDLPPGSGYSSGVIKDKILRKRLVFEREKVEKLRKEARGSEIKDPTKVEAVSAFFWRIFIEANNNNNNNKAAKETTSFVATHVVNLRPRAVPPLPDHTFGNCITVVVAMISSEEYDESSTYSSTGMLVSKLRGAVRSKATDNNDMSKLFDRILDETAVGDMFKSTSCCFSSWLRFPMYEVDFGWGKPVWICTETMPFMNLVVLIDTPSGDGVEAWINVNPDDHRLSKLLQHNYDKLSIH